MKRPKQHVMEEESERLLKTLIPSEWIVRPILKDYGVDYEIELVDQESVSGNRIWIQIKAVEKSKIQTQTYSVNNFPPDFAADSTTSNEGKVKADYIPFSLDVKELNYALKCAFPLLLFVADLNRKDIYWLPIRDEIVGCLSHRNPEWHSQKSATLHLPVWNCLSWEKEKNFPGLRWYALEPARMYAFTTLHYYHHEFRYTGRLSGYEIGDGWMDHGEEIELKNSLQLAHNYISSAIKLDVLFGDNGIDYFNIPIPFENAFILSMVSQLKQALDAVTLAIEMLNTHKYTWGEMANLVGRIDHAINLLSTAISAYQGFRQKFLLTEASAVWRAAYSIHGMEGAPIFPMSRKPRF